MEVAVFVLVRVEADSIASAEKAVSAVLDNAINDDTTGLQPAGEITDFEFQDAIANN